MEIGGPCHDDAQCDDGDMCNGTELCADGICQITTSGALSNGASCGVNHECVDQACIEIDCGNGVLNTGEQCDEGPANSTAPDACRPTCELPRCGDGVKDSGEACDEGNLVDGPTCSKDCQVLAECGDGIIHAWAGEQCDFGTDTPGCDQCSVLPGFGCDEEGCFGVIYVDAQAADDGNGQTWTSAYQSLHDALVEAYEWTDADGRPQPKEIWLAQGTYVPPFLHSAQYSSFYLVNHVDLYGGFAGGEVFREERDPEAHFTILSGDVEGDDAVDPLDPTGWDPDTRDDNRQRVITVTAGIEAVVDGVIIVGGHAAPDSCATAWHCYGAGVLFRVTRPSNPKTPNLVGSQCPANGASVWFRNVAFLGNFAKQGGGAIATQAGSYCSGRRPSIYLENCLLANNRTLLSGGAVRLGSTVTEVFEASQTGFSHNGASVDGGALMTYNRPVELYDVTFDNNYAGRHGGAIAVYQLIGGIVDMHHASFTSNSAGGHGGAIYGTSVAALSLVYGRFEENFTRGDYDGFEGSSRGGALYLDDGSTMEAKNVEVVGNTSRHWGGAMLLNNSEADFYNAVFFDNTIVSSGGGGAVYCPNSRATFNNVTFAGNGVAAGSSVTHGGRAVHYGTPDQPCELELFNSIVWSNGSLQIYTQTDDSTLRVDYSLIPFADDNDNNLSTNPLFVNLAAGNLRLESASPAINKGNPATNSADYELEGGGGIAVDLDGHARFVGRIDMGAYEYQDSL